jgi:hypothetical protein
VERLIDTVHTVDTADGARRVMEILMANKGDADRPIYHACDTEVGAWMLAHRKRGGSRECLLEHRYAQGPGQKLGASLVTRKRLFLSRGPGRKPGASLVTRGSVSPSPTLHCAQPGRLRTRPCPKVANIDVMNETPVGHGDVICFSVFCGPEIHFDEEKRKSLLWVGRCGLTRG